MDIDPITELQRCFALVRPVGMTDSAARDWLAAAVAEVRHLRHDLLAKACAEARKTVTHHSQIIPSILAGAVEQSKPNPFAWALACHSPTAPMQHIDGPTGGARMLGDIVKGIEYDGDR